MADASWGTGRIRSEAPGEVIGFTGDVMGVRRRVADKVSGR